MFGVSTDVAVTVLRVAFPVTCKSFVVVKPATATLLLNVEIPDTSTLFTIDVVPPSDVKFKLLPTAEIALGDSIPIETLLIVAPPLPSIGPVNVDTPVTANWSSTVTVPPAESIVRFQDDVSISLSPVTPI